MSNNLWRTIGVALTIAVSGCTRSETLPAATSEALDPIVFFTGRSHGDGQLDKLFGRRVKVLVDSIGRREADTLILDQTIREGLKPPRTRRWTMRLIAPNQYSGTLTDASGPVKIAVSGARAYIRYTMKNGMNVEQQLAVQSGGGTILNRLVVHRFGLPLATLNETIRRVP